MPFEDSCVYSMQQHCQVLIDYKLPYTILVKGFGYLGIKGIILAFLCNKSISISKQNDVVFSFVKMFLKFVQK